MRLFILFLLSCSLFAKTAVNDKPAADKLLGIHPLSLQWVTFDTTKGSAVVTNADGTFRLKGQQKGKDNNMLSIEGELLEINAKDFVFQGKIVTRVSHIADGKDCVREGKFLFRISGARQFWRLREQQNPCEDVADYIDIFFMKSK